MNAGTGLDALVAEQVMGQRRVGDCPLGASDCIGKYEPQIGRWPCLAPYSTDIAAAWEVALHLGWDHGDFKVEHIAADAWGPEMYVDSHWLCVGERGDGTSVEATAPTAPHAICLAALRAVGVEP